VILSKHLKKLTKHSFYEKSTATVAKKIAQVEKQQKGKEKKPKEKEKEKQLKEQQKEKGKEKQPRFKNIRAVFSHMFRPQAHDNGQDQTIAQSSHVQGSLANKIAAKVVDEAAGDDAERYADDLVRKIQQGTTIPTFSVPCISFLRTSSQTHVQSAMCRFHLQTRSLRTSLRLAHAWKCVLITILVFAR
jgi:hypothetical protein